MIDPRTERPARESSFDVSPWRRYRTALFQSYLIVALVVFAILAVQAHTVPYYAIDLTISRAIQSTDWPGLEPLMTGVSYPGFSPQVDLVAVVIALFLFFSGLKWEGVTSLFAAASISFVSSQIKNIVDRPRPSADLVHVAARLPDFSFPSGHVLFYTVFFGFLFFLGCNLLERSWRRSALLIVLGGLVALIGVSRIYLGQHWASDVLGGYLLGSVWLTLMVYLYRWGKPRFLVTRLSAEGSERN